MTDLRQIIADLARPFSIIATSLSAAVVPVIVVWRTTPDRLDLSAAAILVGALYAGVAGLYWGRAWENQKVSGHTAEVEKERAKASPPPPEALRPAPPPRDEERSLEEPA